MRHKTSIEIFNYWNRIRGSADAPLRAQIEPGSIRHILPQIFILEMTDIGESRFRLAGTMICNLFGRELRDALFSSLWSGNPLDSAVKIAKGVMDHAVPALLNATGYTGSGRSMSFEVILLPMRSSADRCDRLLGCLVPTNGSAWLGAEPLASLVLDRSRLLDDQPTAAEALPVAPKAAKSVLVARGAELSLAVRRVLHLKVFEGGRAG
jgi:hypothetical protein